LKHNVTNPHFWAAQVAEIHPVKQGLKRKEWDRFKIRLKVAEIHPVKQGLKPGHSNFANESSFLLQRYIQ